ncbi:hypothetical protein I3W98_37175, partial [Streptomyces cavourensis]|nr:hypothetical protein [Streptomyces cavourensis]
FTLTAPDHTRRTFSGAGQERVAAAYRTVTAERAREVLTAATTPRTARQETTPRTAQQQTEQPS